jgi:phospho-N-acetylmuramoyl-pentapeptide-transferase
VIYHLLEYLFPRNYGYQNALFRGSLAILTAFLCVWLLGPRVIRYLMHKRLGDIPDFDHQGLNELTKHKANVPTMGGALILFSIVVAVLLFANLATFYIWVCIFCLVCLGGIGAWDDWLKLTKKGKDQSRDGLKFYQKLLFQIGLGVVLAVFIYKRGAANVDGYDARSFSILVLPFVKEPITLSIYAFIFITVLVITGTSNAVNLTDGMDGLAGGCSAMCCFAFMVLTWVAGDSRVAAYLLVPHVPESGELAVLCGAMMGACIGFLWYNCHPAQVFMGDTGSLPLGGLIGAVAIVIRQEVMLLIVGGVFVIEALSVMLQVGYFKATGGKRIFRVAPIHHHFQLGGWTETQVVTRFWMLSALFAILALATVKLR